MAKNDIDILINVAAKNQKVLDTIAEDLDEVKESTTGAGLGFVKLDSFINLASKGFNFLKGAIGKGIGALKDFTALTKEATKGLDIQRGFVRSFGDDVEKNLGRLREASKGTIDDVKLMEVSNKAALLGISTNVEDLAALMTTARLRGKELGIDTTQAFDDIVTGIGRGSPLILDNLGIKIPEAFKEATKEMSETEKMQALLNLTIEDGAKLAEEYGGDVMTTADVFESLSARIANAKQEVGEFGNEIMNIIIQDSEWISSNKDVQGVINDVSTALIGLREDALLFVKQTWEDFHEVIEENPELIKNIRDSINDLLVALGILSDDILDTRDGNKEFIKSIVEGVPKIIDFITSIIDSIEEVGNFILKVHEARQAVRDFFNFLLDLSPIGFMTKVFEGVEVPQIIGQAPRPKPRARARNVRGGGGSAFSQVQGIIQQTARGYAKGGIVKPVYAQAGFIPRGTDTVPAMLTPGEMVLPTDITSRLMDMIKGTRMNVGMGGGGLTLNVNVTGNMIDSEERAEGLSNRIVQKVLNVLSNQNRLANFNVATL